MARQSDAEKKLAELRQAAARRSAAFKARHVGQRRVEVWMPDALADHLAKTEAKKVGVVVAGGGFEADSVVIELRGDGAVLIRSDRGDERLYRLETI